MLNRSHHIAAFLVGMLLCASPVVYADDYQDAGMLFKQGRYDQSLEKVNAYLAGKPGDAKARFLKGLIVTKQGNTPEAIKIFQALTVDYPELPEPYNNLAVLYAGQGQYDKAKVALEKAIRTHPSYATAHENLGDIYARMASQAYDRALQLDRGNIATQSKLAMIQELYSGAAPGKTPPPSPPAVPAAAADKVKKSVAAAPDVNKLAPPEKSDKTAADRSSEV
ncbi:MAG: tetratricopeptide repeat protein, partial [Gallionella sp.]|nr:tetratricopeptide repeat protein [Gallionella sp.]